MLNQTEKDDIFALGTVLYEISVGHRLYADKSDREINQLFQKREFPDLTSLGPQMRDLIQKCWLDQYGDAEEIVRDLGEIVACWLQWVIGDSKLNTITGPDPKIPP